MRLLTEAAFLKRFFALLLGLVLAACLLVVPYTCWWLHSSGDLAVERAVKNQAAGRFALFGSGVSQDFVDYKLQLYAAVKPQVVALGSSRVMQFRGAYFRRPFLNVGGTAGNLPVLRSTLDAMLRLHRPEAVILGLDFWWFMPRWNPDPFKEEPPTSGSYGYNLDSLKKPWTWLLEGKISWRDLLGPVLPRSLGGFRDDRYGIKAFAPSPPLKDSRDVGGISTAHLDAFAEIYCRLKARGIATYVFIAPLSITALDALRAREEDYPHLFRLRDALLARGIEVMDFTDPRTFAATDCEFVDGFHGGEVVYARILRDMADRWSSLLAYVDMDKINAVIRDWRGHALVPDPRLTDRPEVDFMRSDCPKRR